MRLIFILSTIILLYCFLLIKKNNKEQNILFWSILSIVIFMCYNAIISWLLSLAFIPNYLIIKSLINILISLLLYFNLIKNKDKQKYSKVDYKDIIVIILILLITLIIGYKRFGLDLNIGYESGDSSVHYLNAKLYYDTKLLLGRTHIEDLYGSRYGSVTMFFSYVNAGTFFSLFDFLVGSECLYKLYNLFELLYFFIGGILFYFTIRNNRNTIKNMLIPVLLTIIYLFGYPLNNMIFGFHYLGISIILINLLLVLFKFYFDDDMINKGLLRIIIIGVSFSLFTCYYLFVPIIYGGLGLYILYLWHINHKFKFKKAIKEIVILLVIPFIIGIIYYFVIQRINTTSSVIGDVSNTFASEGYIYRNLIGNFIFLLPIGIYELYLSIKNRQVGTIEPVIVFTSLITILLFVLTCKEYVSTYYFYKFYYVLWLLMFILIGNNIKRDNGLTNIMVVMYSIIIILSITKVEDTIKDSSKYINPNSILSNITDIYVFNYDKLNYQYWTFNKDEVSTLYKITSNDNYYSNKNSLILNGSINQKSWYYSLTGVLPSAYTGNYYAKFYSVMPFSIIEEHHLKCFIDLSDSGWTQDNKISKKYVVNYEDDNMKLYCLK